MQNQSQPQEVRPNVDTALLSAMRWRLIGPHRGGRVVAVAGDPSDPLVFYFGACDGGVWKTQDGGISWRNVSDGYFEMAAVGAIAVAKSDPNVVYAGMGETTIRGNVSHGNGIYKSTDGGRTWRHVGLPDTQAIGRIRIHPKNPDIAYVAALGHIWGNNAERGVFRTTDSGASWQQVLFKSEKAGAVDLSLDPNNPRILYASIWEASRSPSSLSSGGPDSGLWKSTDGGDTWTDITRNPGLPSGILGKIGVAVSPARSDRVWAIVEAEKGGVYRSDDGGANWQLVNDDTELRQRPWYYMHIYGDPVDAETMYVLNLQVWRSTDAGRTYRPVPVPHGDTHDLWIDPRNPRRMINGNDGGACVTFDGGVSWSSIFNQPTAQFYHVVTDNQVPYRVYGAQQDNTTLSVPSRSDSGAITFGDCYPIGGGESGYIAVRPDDPNIVYAGSYGGLITRYDHRARQAQVINAWPENSMGWPARDLKYRFQWTYPIVLSPHDPNVLYVTSNHVHRSTDEGRTWEVVSGDLTRNDSSRMGDSGGPLTHDNTSVEYYGTIFAFAESPVERGVLWTGSDDGVIHVSRDNGRTWRNVTPGALPEWALISIIEPSPHVAGVAYVAATCYKLDDFTPYLFKTSDYGQSWTRITEGIGDNDFTRAIREDPSRRGLLYAGTETGIYVSVHDGDHWQPLQLNLPVCPIHDLAVKGTDLVAATHGRSFWVLDDLTPLHQFSEAVQEARAHLFQPQPATRYRGALRRVRFDANNPRNFQSAGGAVVMSLHRSETDLTFLDAGTNPPDGVIVWYVLKAAPEGEVKLTFLDSAGREIKSFSSEAPPEPATNDKEGRHGPRRKKEPRASKEAGLNRFVWNMRYPDAEELPGAVLWAGTTDGPLAPPGRYQVRLTVSDQTFTEPFEIIKDPRISATDGDLEAQFLLLAHIRDKVSDAHRSIKQVREVRSQLDAWEQRAADNGEIVEAAKAIKEAITAVEEELIQVKSKSMEDPLNFPIKLNNKLAALTSVVASADARPTQPAHEVFEELASAVDTLVNRLHGILETDVPHFNALVRQAGIPAVAPRAEVSTT